MKILIFEKNLHFKKRLVTIFETIFGAGCRSKNCKTLPTSDYLWTWWSSFDNIQLCCWWRERAWLANLLTHYDVSFISTTNVKQHHPHFQPEFVLLLCLELLNIIIIWNFHFFSLSLSLCCHKHHHLVIITVIIIQIIINTVAAFAYSSNFLPPLSHSPSHSRPANGQQDNHQHKTITIVICI